MFSDPEKNIAQFGLREGMKVADLGSGTGYYTRAVSSRVGPSGHVYAIEVQKGLVKRLESELKELGYKNVECIWADVETKGGTKLADESVDAVILSNILFQVSDILGLITETRRILKHGGKVLVVDWVQSFDGMGPAPYTVVPEKKARDMFRERGFKEIQTISAGPYQYGIIFEG
ncbi:MAG: class I SAM-dependent methyltransferase [Candidatus Pacebacteria bacterium]|jgi:ubiquinone/menaquinone biosynthesis C-methylase UbiE|nr:class I SAM-dependent methyltransferase [Candidatus Paceibacterota bacterium]